MRYKQIVISISCICFLNISFGQFNDFINRFKHCSLPLVIKEETFDIYHSDDDRVVISEEDVVKYLMLESDTFINIKKSSEKTGYHKYIAVCKFDVHNDFWGVLYFRTLNRDDGNKILELMLSVLTKKGKLISTYPISGFYTAENIAFDATIFNAENIEILFYKLETHKDRFGTFYLRSENIIEKKYFYITKQGLIQSKK